MDESRRSISLPGRIDQVREACDFVVSSAKEAGFSEDGIFQSQLAIEEIFTNIVEHGYQYDGADKSIEILVELRPDALVINIFDEAPPFNPLDIDTPNPDTSLWERKGGGWGVFFVRQYIDDIQYAYEDNRNRLILTKKK